MREEVLRKYLPQVPFEDHSPQQLPVDDEAELSNDELRRGLPVTQALALGLGATEAGDAAATMIQEVLHDAIESMMIVA